MDNVIQSKKSLSPIIAVILILMITIAGAAAAFFWFIRMQSELQGSTETYSEDLNKKITSRIEVNDAEGYTAFNITEEDAWNANATLYIQNRGTKSISINDSDITAILKKDENTLCSGTADSIPIKCISGCTGTIEENQLTSLIFEFNATSCNADEGRYKLFLDLDGEASAIKEFDINE